MIENLPAFERNKMKKKEEKKISITTPAPFEFLNKEKISTISEKKFEEYLLQKQKELMELENYVYRARKVPDHVHQDL